MAFYVRMRSDSLDTVSDGIIRDVPSKFGIGAMLEDLCMRIALVAKSIFFNLVKTFQSMCLTVSMMKEDRQVRVNEQKFLARCSAGS
jgi:hypothetical protein